MRILRDVPCLLHATARSISRRCSVKRGSSIVPYQTVTLLREDQGGIMKGSHAHRHTHSHKHSHGGSTHSHRHTHSHSHTGSAHDHKHSGEHGGHSHRHKSQ